MTSRAEVTTKYARADARARKMDKGRVRDQVVAVTGWSRDNTRRRLVAAAQREPGAGRQVARTPGKQRARKYSYDALRVLAKVWAASGGQCGKYLAESMWIQLDGLERHGELVERNDRYSPIGSTPAARATAAIPPWRIAGASAPSTQPPSSLVQIWQQDLVLGPKLPSGPTRIHVHGRPNSRHRPKFLAGP